jgi:hypothetical protein
MVHDLPRDGVRITTVLDDDYPANLRLICNLPPFLTYSGTLERDDARSVAVMGTSSVCSDASGQHQRPRRLRDDRSARRADATPVGRRRSSERSGGSLGARPGCGRGSAEDGTRHRRSRGKPLRRCAGGRAASTGRRSLAVCAVLPRVGARYKRAQLSAIRFEGLPVQDRRCGP